MRTNDEYPLATLESEGVVTNLMLLDEVFLVEANLYFSYNIVPFGYTYSAAASELCSNKRQSKCKTKLKIGQHLISLKEKLV